VIVPEIKKLPRTATRDERQAAYQQYCHELVSRNPHHFLPPGVRRRWWHFGLVEHPLTKDEK
jgi:hypothetical protein